MIYVLVFIISFLLAKFLYDNLMLRIEKDGLKRDIEALKNRIKTLEKELYNSKNTRY